MTSTQKFEGPDMAALLDEVQATLGPTARVIAANRRRSGGLAGFFTKESFEVTVELPDTRVPSSGTTDRKRRRSENSAVHSRDSRSALEQLLDAADRSDELMATHGPGLSASNNQRRANSGRTDPGRTDSRRTDTERRIESAATRLQTPASNFADALDRAESERNVIPEPDARSAPADRAPRRTDRPKEGSMSNKLFRRRNSTKFDDGPVERIIDLSSFEEARGDATLSPRGVRSHAYPISQTAPDSAGQYFPRGDVPVMNLAAIGVPPQWLTGAINGRVLMENVLARIPSPPSIVHGPGAILAFVGEGEMCLNTARAVSTALRQDPNHCVLLSPGVRVANNLCVQITSIDELADRRASWVQEDHAVVVAIDAGFARPDVAWGRHAISVLHPSLRWGVVSATRKVEDIYGWARGVGGLHALAVHGMSDTASPASILSTGVPVARIDGQVASTVLWRKILDDRLAQAATRRIPDLITT